MVIKPISVNIVFVLQFHQIIFIPHVHLGSLDVIDCTRPKPIHLVALV